MTGNYTSVILELGQVSTVAYLELLLPGAGPKFVVPLRPIMKYSPPPQKKGGGGETQTNVTQPKEGKRSLLSGADCPLPLATPLGLKVTGGNLKGSEVNKFSQIYRESSNKAML